MIGFISHKIYIFLISINVRINISNKSIRSKKHRRSPFSANFCTIFGMQYIIIYMGDLNM